MQTWYPFNVRETKLVSTVLLLVNGVNVTALVEIPAPDYLIRLSRAGWNLFYAFYPGQIHRNVIEPSSEYPCEVFAARSERAATACVADLMSALPPVAFVHWFCETRPIQTLLDLPKQQALGLGIQRLEQHP